MSPTSPASGSHPQDWASGECAWGRWLGGRCPHRPESPFLGRPALPTRATAAPARRRCSSSGSPLGLSERRILKKIRSYVTRTGHLNNYSHIYPEKSQLGRRHRRRCHRWLKGVEWPMIIKELKLELKVRCFPLPMQCGDRPLMCLSTFM